MRRVFTGELIIQHSYGIFVHITWSEIAECMDSISVYQFPILSSLHSMTLEYPIYSPRLLYQSGLDA